MPVKVSAGSRVGIHINYTIYSEEYERSKDPSNYILVYVSEQLTAGLGGFVSKFMARLKYLLQNPILALLELSDANEFTKEPLEISSPNPDTFTSYSRGWMIGKTASRIERNIRNVSVLLSLIGTLIWAYGDLHLTGLRCL